MEGALLWLEPTKPSIEDQNWLGWSALEGLLGRSVLQEYIYIYIYFDFTLKFETPVDTLRICTPLFVGNSSNKDIPKWFSWWFSMEKSIEKSLGKLFDGWLIIRDRYFVLNVTRHKIRTSHTQVVSSLKISMEPKVEGGRTTFIKEAWPLKYPILHDWICCVDAWKINPKIFSRKVTSWWWIPW